MEGFAFAAALWQIAPLHAKVPIGAALPRYRQNRTFPSPQGWNKRERQR